MSLSNPAHATRDAVLRALPDPPGYREAVAAVRAAKHQAAADPLGLLAFLSPSSRTTHEPQNAPSVDG